MINDVGTLNAPHGTFTHIAGNHYTIFHTPPEEKWIESEPQNALTEIFTYKEWKALRELRESLPRIFSDAYRDRPLNERILPVHLWGVLLDPCGPPDPRVSVLLIKFLRAHNLDIHKTQEKLVNTLRWREKYGINTLVQQFLSDDALRDVAYVHGQDKSGQPVVYLRQNNDLLKDPQRLIDLQIALFEHAMSFIDFETVDCMTLINDMHDISMLSTLRVAAQFGLYTQTFLHFSELIMYRHFVSCEYVVNDHDWLSRCYNAIGALYELLFFPMKRVHFGSNPDKIFQGLSAVIDKKQLPRRYGGEAD